MKAHPHRRLKCTLARRKVLDCHNNDQVQGFYRRRACTKCGHRTTTWEMISEADRDRLPTRKCHLEFLEPIDFGKCRAKTFDFIEFESFVLAEQFVRETPAMFMKRHRFKLI